MGDPKTKLWLKFEWNPSSGSGDNGRKPLDQSHAELKIAAVGGIVRQMSWYANQFWWRVKRTFDENLK